MVNIVTWSRRSFPWSVLVFPLEPFPPQSQSPAKTVNILHTEPTITLGTRLQFTRLFPPTDSSSTDHRKFLLILSIFLMNHLSGWKLVRKKVAVAVTTELMYTSLPILFSILPFLGASLPATLSRTSCNSALHGFRNPSGRPRYWHGKLSCTPRKAAIRF